MEKATKLKDGTDVLLRSMTKDDLEKSLAFFQGLPEEDRTYLRRDVTKRRFVEERIREIDSGRVKRLVAVVRGEIAADGALELADHGWGEDVGEIRLIIARPYQRKGLGLLMAGALYELAAGSGVKEIVVRMMRPQKAARGIFRTLGFREEVFLPDYAKDRTGKRQDVILGRCDLEALWRELEHYMGDSDWQRTR